VCAGYQVRDSRGSRAHGADGVRKDAGARGGRIVDPVGPEGRCGRNRVALLTATKTAEGVDWFGDRRQGNDRVGDPTPRRSQASSTRIGFFVFGPMRTTTDDAASTAQVLTGNASLAVVVDQLSRLGG